MNFTSIKNIDLKDKIILLRADLNVPAQLAKVTDTTRIDRLKPTIDFLREKGAKIVILSHYGRPEGEQNPEMSLAFLAPTLQSCWGVPVKFSPTCIGERAQDFAANLKAGEIGLLENIRFHKGEQSNDPAFAKELAKLGDIYVNDAFSCSHRAHASTEGLAHLLPSAAGLLMEEELNALESALGNPQRPVAAVAGGSKISSKLSVLYNLSKKVDFLILGGGMANTFLFANGANIGGSLCEKDMADEARKIMAHAKKNGCEIILPTDLVCVKDLHEGAEFTVLPATDIPEEQKAIDAGPDSVATILKKISTCKTIVWNGPLGVFEIKPFDKATNDLAQAVAQKSAAGELVSIAGGGDTVAALDNAGVINDFSYISTAGGAFLEWLEGSPLPGVLALETNSKAA